ncbi:MAG: glycosyltransferase [Candidatus Goldbacteria bacterium]|nr:glycosyltransferase [Candidatus Goldiibacteriota bacterium]
MKNIIAIYPAFNIGINEMANVWLKITQLFEVNLIVITNTVDYYKNFESKEGVEKYGNITIFRMKKIKISNLMPIIKKIGSVDLVFCAVHINKNISLKLARYFNCITILHTEFFFSESFLPRGKKIYIKLGIQKFINFLFRKYLENKFDIIITSNPKEKVFVNNKNFFYLPWPISKREKRQSLNISLPEIYGIYIGSISKFKDSKILFEFIDYALSNLTELNFVIIGPFFDHFSNNRFFRLKKKFNQRIKYLPKVGNEYIESIIEKSLFTFVPSQNLCWGLINDSLQLNKIIIAVNESYELINNKNALIVNSKFEFVEKIKYLLNNNIFTDNIINKNIIQEHSLESVSFSLFNILNSSKTIQSL